MRLPNLVWDAWNREHIRKHKVKVKEVEEAYRNIVGKSGSYDNREMFLGLPGKVVRLRSRFSYAKQKRPYIVSVRDMSKKERRKYI